MISVVVTTFNRREVLARCLQALEDQDCPPTQFEVIVVVDGSTDGTLEYLRSLRYGPALTVIDQPNRGLAAARNAGLAAARFEIVLFLDDDLLCKPRVVSDHLKAHTTGGKVLAFGPVLVAAAPLEAAAARLTRTYYADSIYGPLAQGESPVWPIHARVPPNSSISREVLLEFGGFDEAFVNAHEDIELGIRLWRGGVNFIYLPDAKVEHLYTKSSRDLAVSEARRTGKFEILLCRKHPVYRSESELAASQTTRMFASGVGDILLKFPIAGQLARSAFATARRLPLESVSGRKEEWLLAREGNLNMLQSAVCEAGSWRQFRAEFWMRLPVLMYHQVGAFKRNTYPGLTVDPGRFALQMEWLANNGYQPIDISDWIAWCESAKPLPENPVLITFDDAYANLVEYAFPVLRKHRFKAVVFVPTAYIDQSNIWDQANGSAPIRLMSADSIKRWAADGIEFGAHSRTHPELDRISAAALQEEVEGSRAELEKIVEAPVAAFAYPYGNYNRQVEEVVSRNFRLAFTTEDGLNNLGTNPMRLHRTMVQSGDTLVDFASRIRFGYSIPEQTKARIRRLLRM